MPALCVWLFSQVCAREEEHSFCVCVCKSSPLISKQIEMKYGKTRAKQIREQDILFTVDNKVCNKPRNKFIKRYVSPELEKTIKLA